MLERPIQTSLPMQRVVAIPVVDRGFDDSAQRHARARASPRPSPTATVRGSRGRRGLRAALPVDTATPGEYLAERDCAAVLRRPAHPIERGLEAAERERCADAHHHVEARRLRAKIERRSFNNLDSMRKTFRGNEPARLGREGRIDLERRHLNVEPLGEPTHQPTLAASDVEYAHSVADRHSSGSLNPASLREVGFMNRVISLDRCVEFKKVQCSLLLLVAESILPQKDLAVVANAFPRRATAPGETFCRCWNDANDLASSRAAGAFRALRAQASYSSCS